MKKLIVLFLVLSFFVGTTFAAAVASSNKPNNVKKVTQQTKNQIKKPIKKPVKPTVKKTQNKVQVKKILSFIPFSGIQKCVGPDGKTAYAPKKACDDLWSFWNKNKPSNPSSNNSSNNNSSNNNANSSSNNSSLNNNTPEPTATPTLVPTETPAPTETPTPTVIPAPSIAVTSPNGGENLQQHGTYRITWNASNDIDTVMIGLTSGPGDLGWITTYAVPNTGYYDWEIYTGRDTVDYQAKIVIYGIKDSMVVANDESDAMFTLLKVPPTNPNPISITVTSPNGGEVVTADESYRITWTNTNNVDRVSIYVNAFNSFRSLVVDNIPNTGYFDWIVGLLVPETNLAKIEVIGWASGLGNKIDESDDFFTVQYPTPTPTLTPAPTLPPTLTPTPTLTPPKMKIDKVSVLPCTSSSCNGITTVIVEGSNFFDDAVLYLYRTDSDWKCPAGLSRW